MASKDNKSKAI